VTVRAGTPLPTFAIIGAARSGTTAIAEALRAHPDGFVTDPKEPHYFAFAGQRLGFTGPGDDTGINQRAITNTGEYLALYRDTEDRVARGEGSVSTLYYYAHAIPAIMALNPDVRLLVVLRDPVDRAFSSYQYLRMRGRETQDDFATAVSLEPSRRAAGWHHLWHYTAMSHYADAIDAFLRAFGRDRLCVLLYDDVTRDPVSALRTAYLHVGLDPGRAGIRSAPRVNTSGQARSARAQDLLNRLARRPAVKRTGRVLVPFGVRERVRRWNQSETTTPAAARAELAPTFAADLDRVEDLLSLRLPPWGRPRRA
jgi:hypothetical protein